MWLLRLYIFLQMQANLRALVRGVVAETLLQLCISSYIVQTLAEARSITSVGYLSSCMWFLWTFSTMFTYFLLYYLNLCGRPTHLGDECTPSYDSLFTVRGLLLCALAVPWQTEAIHRLFRAMGWRRCAVRIVTQSLQDDTAFRLSPCSRKQTAPGVHWASPAWIIHLGACSAYCIRTPAASVRE